MVPGQRAADCYHSECTSSQGVVVGFTFYIEELESTYTNLYGKRTHILITVLCLGLPVAQKQTWVFLGITNGMCDDKHGHRSYSFHIAELIRDVLSSEGRLQLPQLCIRESC